MKRAVWLTVFAASAWALNATGSAEVQSSPFAATRPATRRLLSEPYLQAPGDDSVVVAWFTEFEGSGHAVTFGRYLERTARATTTRMTRMFEDADSDLRDDAGRPRYDALVERPVWRHEALVTGLERDERVPYYVTSVDGDDVARSAVYSLQPTPTPGSAATIVLTSDQQNRAMSAGTFQRLVETVGIPDAVLFAGDFVDNPHRASEWFDRDNEGRPAFFPSLQGTFGALFPDHPYRGGPVLQHAPLFGTLGNHESPGRFAQHRAVGSGINAVDNDPQPRWYARYRYDREVASGRIEPPADPARAAEMRERFVRDWSYEHTAYIDLWNHPDDGPAGERYWSRSYGDIFIISMHVNRVWRNWNPGLRGKFSEDPEHLNNPDEWGFGDMFFERYGIGSEQYEWLVEQLESDAFRNARFQIVLAHQTMFGLGDNALPVMADPVATITYRDQSGDVRTMRRSWPADASTFASDVVPLADRNAIIDVSYEYPIAEDIWRREIEPLLLEYGVDLVHVGHSHLWNRARVGSLNYLETSNYGNSFGAGYRDANLESSRAPWARFPGDEGGAIGPAPEDYPRQGDAHGREPIFPTILNPEVHFGESETPVPFVSSNRIGVFTVLDTGDGIVRSYAYDWERPEQPVVLFDEFGLGE